MTSDALRLKNPNGELVDVERGAEFRLERVQVSSILGENVGRGAGKESRNRFPRSPTRWYFPCPVDRMLPSSKYMLAEFVTALFWSCRRHWLVLGCHGTTSFCSSFE